MRDEIIDELTRGSIDLHVHVGPDPAHRPGGSRRFDVAQIAEMAKAAGQPAVACKSHQQITASLATLASRMVPGITLLGGITLNKTVGGLNPHAVRLAGELGARILWFPTLHAAHHLQRAGSPEPGISLFTERKDLRPEVEEILDLVQRYDLLLCTGHVSFPEALALVQAAGSKGITRIVATHPLSRQTNGYTVAEARQLAELGAMVEFTLIAMMPFARSEDPQITVDAMREIGPERCIITTDFGSYATPPPPEGMRMYVAALLNRGMTPEQIEWMAKRNPARLVA